MTLRNIVVVFVVAWATLICLQYQMKCEQEFSNYEIYQFPKGFLRGLGLQAAYVHTVCRTAGKSF